jgi:hypothetical protein
MLSALLLMTVNGFLINHAQELRMYSLLLLLTTTSLWLFARLVDRADRANRIQLALGAVNLLLVFTHYYGWIIVALEFIWLLIFKRERLRSFIIAAAFVVFCFSPWIYSVSQAARANPSRVNFAWNRPPPASELVGYYANLNGPLSYRWRAFGTTVVLLVFLAPVIAWGSRVIRGSDREHSSRFWWLALFAFAPPVLSFVASHVLPQSAWAFRYLIISAPAYLLMISVAASRLKSRRLRMASVVLILGWSSVSGFTEIASRDKITWQPLVQRMIDAESAKSDVKVYCVDANVGNTIQFYLDEAGETRLRAEFVSAFNSIGDDHYWVAFIRYKHEDQPLLQSTLTERGNVVGDGIGSEAAGQRALLFPVWQR